MDLVISSYPTNIHIFHELIPKTAPLNLIFGEIFIILRGWQVLCIIIPKKCLHLSIVFFTFGWSSSVSLYRMKI